MIVDCQQLSPAELYPLLAGLIVPRPIAWVSTVDNAGRSNLAPFSFFQLVTDAPPTLMISINRRFDGSRKDTSRNIADTGELVVHLVSPSQLEVMNASAAELAYGDSEIEALQLATLPSLRIRPARLQQSLLSMECRLVSLTPYPAQQSSCDIVLAEVLLLHIDDSLLTAEGKVNHQQVDWLARLGGLWYSHSQQADNRQLARPAAKPRR